MNKDEASLILDSLDYLAKHTRVEDGDEKRIQSIVYQLERMHPGLLRHNYADFIPEVFVCKETLVLIGHTDSLRDIIEKGMTDIHTTKDCKCPICNEQLSVEKDVSGYEMRKEHFVKHGLTLEQASYSALKVGDKSIDECFADALGKPEIV